MASRTFAAIGLLALLCVSAHAIDRPRVDLVRVVKSERLLELRSGGTVIRRYEIALGGNPFGHKLREGDERTPEGRYVLDWRNPNSGYHRSIHISYPGAADRAAAAAAGIDPGGMIMIHGQPDGYGWWSWLLQRFDWTNGCIAVTDDDMAEIWAMVPNGTPIEIVP
jgi:murein L,D-transpeptidase YafK